MNRINPLIYEIEKWTNRKKLAVRVASQTPTINSCYIRKIRKGAPAKIMITSKIDAVVSSLIKLDRVENTPFIIG